MLGNSVRRVFFAQGLVIGLVGTAGGLVLGLIASAAIGRGKLIPRSARIFHRPPAGGHAGHRRGIIVLASLGIAALATLYPARQAAKLFPVEAIRHE